MPLLLGSQSPRRKEILSFFSIDFQQVASHFPEESIPFLGDPVAYTEELSRKKGETLLSAYKDHTIITADTVVYLNGKIYNKPASEEEAFSFINELAGQWHQVYTAVTVCKESGRFSGVEQTNILFHPVTAAQIRKYLAHFAYTDKAGGYAVQQGGNIIVSKMEGCYYNVMGLPINTLQRLLLHVGIDLWDHLKIF